MMLILTIGNREKRILKETRKKKTKKEKSIYLIIKIKGYHNTIFCGFSMPVSGQQGWLKNL